ncbi:MAG: hypothetical protein BA066_03515 [Candidatus Korarchaeota archaeon NZ13-K]|nr:MAG: hypothetical protein BA066_03515 [Candidatus Korarchaeota archaeon NZ13-K]
MSETYVLLSIVAALALLFTIGLWRSNKAFKSYAEAIRDYSAPFSNYVGFMRYGRGFKALFMVNEGYKAYRRIKAGIST